MPDIVTREHLRESVTDLREALLEQLEAGFQRTDAGFARTHERLDILNGRIGKAEVSDGQHDVRLKNLEREVFHRRREDRIRRLPLAPLATRDRLRRDIKVVFGTLTGVGAVIVWLKEIWPGIQKLLQ